MGSLFKNRYVIFLVSGRVFSWQFLFRKLFGQCDLDKKQMRVLNTLVIFLWKCVTPWKFNIAPENIPSEKESSLPTIIFQGLR